MASTQIFQPRRATQADVAAIRQELKIAGVAGSVRIESNGKIRLLVRDAAQKADARDCLVMVDARNTSGQPFTTAEAARFMWDGDCTWVWMGV